MPKLTGNCLCGNVSFEAEGEIAMQGNCHCTDCQQVTGATHATLVFMHTDDVAVTGETRQYEHKVDSGNVLIKDFCPSCGSQLFSTNKARANMIGLRAGSINEKDQIRPQFNVFVSSKVPCTILDVNIPAFEKMPG